MCSKNHLQCIKMLPYLLHLQSKVVPFIWIHFVLDRIEVIKRRWKLTIVISCLDFKDITISSQETLLYINLKWIIKTKENSHKEPFLSQPYIFFKSRLLLVGGRSVFLEFEYFVSMVCTLLLMSAWIQTWKYWSPILHHLEFLLLIRHKLTQVQIISKSKDEKLKLKLQNWKYIKQKKIRISNMSKIEEFKKRKFEKFRYWSMKKKSKFKIRKLMN